MNANTTATVHVPCDVFSVQVQLGYDSKLSEIEQVVLRTVHSYPELRGLEELSDALNLGRPLTLDIAFDLMRRRYAMIDFAKGTMRPTPAIAARIDDGTLADLPGAEIIDDRKLVMLDLLSGHVLPLSGRDRLVRSRFAVPVETGSIDLAQVSQVEMLNAVNRTLDREYGDLLRTKAGEGEKARGRRLRALSAYLGPKDRRPVVGQRWMEMRVSLAIEPSTRLLRVRIEDEVLPAARRAAAEARLEQLAVDRPDDDFVRRMRAVASHRDLRAYTFDDYITRMGTVLSGAETAGPGTRKRRHNDLVYAAQRADEILRADNDLEMHVNPVVGRAPLTAGVRQVLGEAQRQIVLASPYTDDAGLRTFFPEIEAALDRGVHVALLWGRRHRDRLSDTARNLLYQFNRGRRAGRVMWSERPSRINTSMAVADDRVAVVAGGSLLNTTMRGQGQLIGALIRSLREDEECFPIETLLSHARRSFPDAAIGDGIATRHGDLRRPTRGAAGARPAGTAETLAGLPDPPVERDDETGAAQMRAWVSAWQAVIDDLNAARHRRALPEVRVIVEDAHRTQMWSALYGSDARVVVGSRNAQSTVVNNRFEEAARRRLDVGATLTVLTRRPGDAKDLAHATLARLEKQYPGPYAERPDRPVDGGVLITDNEVVITGFDLLTDGDGRARREWTTVGLQLRSRNLANAYAALVADHRGPAEADESADEPAPPDGGAAAVAYRLLLGGVDDRDPAAIGRLLEESDNPWTVLARMRDLDHAGPATRLATVVALGRTTSYADPPAQEALHWLVRDLWRAGEFVAAAILRDEVTDPEWSPRHALTAVAAGRHDPYFGAALENAVILGDPRPDEAVALALAAVSALLTGLPVADEATALAGIDELIPDLPPLPEPVGALVAAARGHFAATVGPLPLSSIRREESDERSRQEELRDWAALDDALEQAEQFSFDFDRGTKTHKYLFHPQQAFGALIEVAPRRRPADMRGWLAEHDARNLGRLLDKATAAAVGPAERIVDKRRARYLERLTAVTKLVRRLAAVQNATSEINFDHKLAARMAGKAVADCWPEVGAAVEALGPVEGALANSALNDLAEIREWGSR